MKNTMKKIIAVICLLTLVCTLFAACSKKTEEEVKYEVTEEGTVKITSYTDSSVRTEITIPDEIDGMPVTEIADYSLFNADSLQKITIGKNVKTIGDWGLTNNKRMTEYVVDEANEYFTAVDGILFSKDMKTIISYPTAKNIEFDKFGQTIECKDRTTYVIPDGVEHIANRAFYRCIYLTDITIPATVTTIGDMSFHRCENLTSIDLPDGLVSIGRDAFTYCKALTEIEFPASLESIGAYAFCYDENITHVIFNSAEGSVELGEKWFPTKDGKVIKELVYDYNG